MATVKEHIQHMKDLFNSFDEDQKPIWSSLETILEYEQKMA